MPSFLKMFNAKLSKCYDHRAGHLPEEKVTQDSIITGGGEPLQGRAGTGRPSPVNFRSPPRRGHTEHLSQVLGLHSNEVMQPE
jgi:hypothetical protein